MNRRTLDVLVPVVLGGGVALTTLIISGAALVAVAIIAGTMTAAYFAALRHNLPGGDS